jgi:hypothetical protein
MTQRFVISAGLALAGSLLILLVSLTLAQSQPNASSDTPDDCLRGWPRLSDVEQAACIEQAGGMPQLKATHDAQRQATVQARPTTAPMSGLQTQAALMEARGTPTITPTLPPDGIPPEAHRIERKRPEAGSILSYRWFVSIWRVGAVLSADRRAYAFYVLTPKEECQLHTTTIGPDFSQLPRYEQQWSCPQDIGELTITGATGPTGIISFTNALSQTGIFNLTTEAWTLEGEPWLPTATVTPRP